MRTLFTMIILAALTHLPSLNAQKFNLNFEKRDKPDGLSNEWIRWGDHKLSMTTDEVASGKYAAVIMSMPNGGSFGSVAYPIPAKYQGDSITLVGKMKIEEVQNGFAGLIIRVDGANGPLAFDNMQQESIVGTLDWKEYRVTVPYPEEAVRIYVGGILVGEGTAWFDDFEVTLDGRDLQTLEEVAPKLFPADLDSAYIDGSGITLDSISKIQLQNLELLCRVWGFLKYRHPLVAKGNYNWDYELFRIIPESKTSNFQSALQDWIASFSVAPTTENAGEFESEEFIPNWLQNENLVPLSIRNDLIAIDRRNMSSSHYYIAMAPGIGNPKFKNEAPYREMDWSDDGMKLLALFRYWNMIEYFFPYKHLMDKDWNDVLRKFIPRMINADDELGYKLLLLKLIGQVQDTHANIWMRDPLLQEFHGKKMIPAEVNFIENKAVIVRVGEDISQLQVGDVIEAINGKEISEITSEKIKYCPASNIPTQMRDVARRLLRTNLPTLDLTINRGPSSDHVSLPTTKFDQRFFYQNDLPSHRELEKDIGYIYPGTLKPGEIDSIMSKFLNRRGLVIDLRCYPSDFIVFSLGKYLMPEPTPFVKFTQGDWKEPGKFEFGEPLKVGEKRKDYFKGKVVILINEKTQSQAEYTTMAFRVAPSATVIGSTTAGADGNVSSIILPGGIRTMISGIGVYYPDGSETQRVGIIPDIELKPTLAGVRAGRDELLERAVQMINDETGK